MMIFTILSISHASTDTLLELDQVESSEVDWLNASIISGGLLGYWTAMQFAPEPSELRSEPSGIDLWIEPQWNPKWEWTSDFLGVPYAHYGFNLPILTTVSLVVVGGLQGNWTLTTPMIQSVAITAAITEVTKNLIGRPRPYTSTSFEAAYPSLYNTQQMIELRNNPDTFKSFPSGHTSNAAATYFSAASIIALNSDDQNVGLWTYSAASALTLLTGYSRIRYGKHHLSDTIIGAFLGTTIGLGLSHWNHSRNNPM